MGFFLLLLWILSALLPAHWPGRGLIPANRKLVLAIILYPPVAYIVRLLIMQTGIPIRLNYWVWVSLGLPDLAAYIMSVLICYRFKGWWYLLMAFYFLQGSLWLAAVIEQAFYWSRF